MSNSRQSYGAAVECLWSGAAFGEGPVWMSESRRVRWSDIPGDRILEYDLATGTTAEYATGVEFTNGRTLDLEGNVVQCNHGRRSVERDVGGDVRTLVDRWGSHRLNSPNDVVVASDGTVWFTDPPYGILLPGEGHPGTMEYGGCYVFRFDPLTQRLDAVVTDMAHPNGLAFSPDERFLYVSDTVDPQRGLIRSYPVDVPGAQVGEGNDLAMVTPGCCDGFRVDLQGRIWSSAADGVHVLSPTGDEIGVIPVPEPVANLCFGGRDGNELYITATTSLYRVITDTVDAHRR